MSPPSSQYSMFKQKPSKQASAKIPPSEIQILQAELSADFVLSEKDSLLELKAALSRLKLPQADSHKGQNGKLLIIGGSTLFHAASKWSLDTASRFVDMVFYSSLPSNNKLISQAKGEFWNGIVIPRRHIPRYIEESDCILIGPGMERTSATRSLVNRLLRKYPHKKWVIDAGALQMVDVMLLTETCLLTPHQQEWQLLSQKMGDVGLSNLPGLILRKGEVDEVIYQSQKIEIRGGNPGMTKGGTGDVLSGLAAGLYANNDLLTSALVASYINKIAGESLAKKVGPFFNASDLVSEIPQVLWREMSPV